MSTTDSSDTPRVAYGDQRMSFTMQPCARDGRPINGGNHYANAHTVDDARVFAHQVLSRTDGYLGYRIESVQITGSMYEFRGHAWVPLTGQDYPRHQETIHRTGQLDAR